MRRVLVANRGEIARRVFRTCRSMGISTAAVYSDPDRMALHVRDADVAVPLEGTSSAESYLDIDKVLDAARATGSDAVHPGYGFLAENATFAERCIEAGLIWIGPPPTAMRAMALKVGAKSLAAAAGVPLLPGAEVVGDDPGEWARAAADVGYPLLVKASAGGGGKGMRLVESPDDLRDAVRAARREAASSFGDPTVFVERYLKAPRHVEVQVLADQRGSVVHLFDRDCSLQRRHQKVIEEAPAPGLPAELRRRMQTAAVALSAAISYVGVGTLEFLVAGDEFYFLEMNTRLQVEHPVTEQITGLDLVRLQIQVADGLPLPFAQEEVRAQGHAVEVRLYAEDPAHDFLPSVGTIEHFEPPAADGIRWESGVGSGSEVSPHYDPMLAKVIATAPFRDEAAFALAGNLRHTQITGLRTNRDFLVACLESNAFVAGEVSTGFFDQHPEVLSPVLPAAVVRHAVLGLAHVLRHRSRPPLSREAVVPAGWRSLPAVAQRWSFRSPQDDLTVAIPPPSMHGSQTATVGDEDVVFEVLRVETDLVDLVVDGVRRSLRVRTAHATHWLSTDGWQIELHEAPRYSVASSEAGPSGASAPLPGTIVSVEVKAGDDVQEGQVLVILEAMKMEHRILADVRGTVTAVHVSRDERVDAHQRLVTLEPKKEGEE
jgi:propionyl-CoA carboxylase alpha chain